MTVSDVMALLDVERDERGMRNGDWLDSSTVGMRSFGTGLTRLRKLAKRIGRNREFAHALWKTRLRDLPRLCAGHDPVLRGRGVRAGGGHVQAAVVGRVMVGEVRHLVSGEDTSVRTP